MDRWTIDHLQAPKILATVGATSDGGIEVGDSFRSYNLLFDDPGESKDLLEVLRSGRSADSEVWRSYTSRTLPKHTLELFDDLQSLGLICEGKEITLSESDCALLLAPYIDEAVSAFQSAAKAETARAFGKSVLAFINKIQSGASVNVDSEVLGENNFFKKILLIQVLAWHRICPSALYASIVVLQRIAGMEVDAKLDDRHSIYPAAEVRRCLLSLVWALLRCADDDAAVRLTEVPEIAKPDFAVNFGILSEKYAVTCLEQLGGSRFLEALDEPDNLLILAKAAYAQEFYITDRFIDIIAPAISKRLPRELKKLIRRYYSEEVGHESYELSTCISLGMNEAELLGSLPSPFGQVICDTFSWLAHDEPVAYFACISITEGLPGQRNPVNQKIEDSGLFGSQRKFGSKRHEELNFHLFHQMLPRWFLSQCGVLSIDEQVRTLKFYITMLEMSFRAWEELYHLYVQKSAPIISTKMTDLVR